jgi:glycine/D-amino acid oxidase-like deaminating enzyme
MSQSLDVDVVVFGGGIAGLWTLARLRRAGFSAVLLEAHALGGAQTIASQGIIHGGTKYALTGTLTGSSRAIAAMPGIWRDCLSGIGDLDLSGVRLLSDHQYLWSTGSLGSDVVGFFASYAMRSRVRHVAPGERPEVLRANALKGHVYRLDEPVLDVSSLLHELVSEHGAWCLKIDTSEGLRFVEGAPPALELRDPQAGELRLDGRCLVLAAGAGNERLLAQLGWSKPAMQRRPLHQLMLRGNLPAFFAHCLGAGATPRVTITSHPGADGERIWYLGGQIAEEGVRRSGPEQVATGRRELASVLPWMDLSRVGWAGFRVDRVEPRQPGGRRPERPFLEFRDGVAVAWPTKLAFAPLLAAELLGALGRAGILAGARGVQVPPSWPRPPLARFPWEQVREWS